MKNVLFKQTVRIMRKTGTAAKILPFAIFMWTAATAFAQTDITGKSTDPAFLEAVRTALGISSPTPIMDTDVISISGLNVRNSGIKSLDGIEYFTELDRLNCSDNQLTELDVSGSIKLLILNCNNNLLTSGKLNITGTSLTDFKCKGNYMPNREPDGTIIIGAILA